MRLFTMFMVITSAVALSGCGGDSNSRLPAQANPAINFTTFVKLQLANTSDTREAVNINNARFIYRDLENPDAYANVLDTSN